MTQLYVGSVCVASLRGKEREPETKNSEGVVWRLHHYKELRWSDTAAVLLLQGATIQHVLGPNWALFNGTHRNPGFPKPGIDDVVLVEILSNDRHLAGSDLISVLVK